MIIFEDVVYNCWNVYILKVKINLYMDYLINLIDVYFFKVIEKYFLNMFL